MKDKFNILFVCTGNTCRSPMAEGIARKIATEKGLKNLVISSAGTAAIDGAPATDYAIAAASHWDIDIGKHRSKPLSRQLVEQADLILAMGHEHVRQISNLDGSAKNKTYLLKGFPNQYSKSQAQVDDPIGGTLEQYNQTFLELDEIIRRIFPKIEELAAMEVD